MSLDISVSLDFSKNYMLRFLQMHIFFLSVACVAGVQRGGKGERYEFTKGWRIAVGDTCKNAIVFFIAPSN